MNDKSDIMSWVFAPGYHGEALDILKLKSVLGQMEKRIVELEARVGNLVSIVRHMDVRLDELRRS